MSLQRQTRKAAGQKANRRCRATSQAVCHSMGVMSLCDLCDLCDLCVRCDLCVVCAGQTSLMLLSSCLCPFLLVWTSPTVENKHEFDLQLVESVSIMPAKQCNRRQNKSDNISHPCKPVIQKIEDSVFAWHGRHALLCSCEIGDTFAASHDIQHQ